VPLDLAWARARRPARGFFAQVCAVARREGLLRAREPAATLAQAAGFAATALLIGLFFRDVKVE
jgi:hypothetical protein